MPEVSMLRLADWFPALEQAWERLFPGNTSPPLGWFELAYNEDGRHYHNANHIVRLLGAQRQHPMWGLRDPTGTELDEAAAVTCAIWFHDVVYVTRPPDIDQPRTSNEELSARAWRSWIPNVANFYGDLVTESIRASTHLSDSQHHPGWIRYFLDLDMLGLGDPEEHFHRTTQKVRAEYPISDAAWSAGRRSFWHKLLAKPQIFYNPFRLPAFQQAERAARRNIHNELRLLEDDL